MATPAVPVNLARGMRDFLPDTMRRRRHVIGVVQGVFERHGFEPLETPALERLETLTGKYGEEGDQLLFKVLRRGEGADRGESDMGLRYDLTVPLARVAAMNRNLLLPFRRYQIQPVWRADRPQHGRFREFLQCDVDLVGSTSPVADAECLAVVADSLNALGFAGFRIRLNHREILRSLATVVGAADRESTLLIALDKLDKVGREGVSQDLAERGLEPAAIDRLWALLDRVNPKDSPEDALGAFAEGLPENGQAAIANLRLILAHAHAMGVSRASIAFDPTLARGLDYYTGAVFETVVDEPKIGSLSGGGRYDRLIGMFMGQDLPAVGVSLGLERILAVMEELRLLPDQEASVQVFVVPMEEAQLNASLKAATVLRDHGVSVLTAPEAMKLRKAFKQAEQRRIPFLAMIGPDEQAAGTLTLKRLADGQQWTLPPADLLPHIRD